MFYFGIIDNQAIEDAWLYIATINQARDAVEVIIWYLGVMKD